MLTSPASEILAFKRFDRTLPIPSRQSEKAAAYDLYVRLATTISAGSFGHIPLNVAVKLPPGFWGLLAARSSTHKYGLIPGNGLGIIDEDFCGDEDELRLVVFNASTETVTVERGTRIAQLLIVVSHGLYLSETEQMGRPSRGGIGSTGI